MPNANTLTTKYMKVTSWLRVNEVNEFGLKNNQINLFFFFKPSLTANHSISMFTVETDI